VLCSHCTLSTLPRPGLTPCWPWATRSSMTCGLDFLVCQGLLHTHAPRTTARARQTPSHPPSHPSHCLSTGLLVWMVDRWARPGKPKGRRHPAVQVSALCTPWALQGCAACAHHGPCRGARRVHTMGLAGVRGVCKPVDTVGTVSTVPLFLPAVPSRVHAAKWVVPGPQPTSGPLSFQPPPMHVSDTEARLASGSARAAVYVPSIPVSLSDPSSRTPNSWIRCHVAASSSYCSLHWYCCFVHPTLGPAGTQS
jgi:hypothetical protein